MVDILKRQFEPSWVMLEKTIDAWPDELWATADLNEPPAWQVLVHILTGMEYWMQPEPGKYTAPKFDKGVNTNLGEPSEEVLTKKELKEYFNKVRKSIDAYFAQLSEQLLQEASVAYDQWTNLDVIIENIRHAQHHLGQLNARLKTTGHLPVEWAYYNPA